MDFQMDYSVKEYPYGNKYVVTIQKCQTIASFDIYNYMGIPSMSISIEDEHQGKGYTRIMMREMMRRLNWPGDTILYIDTDASCGFWRHIGMKENTNGNGYELCITVNDLNDYVK